MLEVDWDGTVGHTGTSVVGLKRRIVMFDFLRHQNTNVLTYYLGYLLPYLCRHSINTITVCRRPTADHNGRLCQWGGATWLSEDLYNNAIKVKRSKIKVMAWCNVSAVFLHVDRLQTWWKLCQWGAACEACPRSLDQINGENMADFHCVQWQNQNTTKHAVLAEILFSILRNRCRRIAEVDYWRSVKLARQPCH